MKILLLIDWHYPCDHQFLTHVYTKNLQQRGHEVTWVMRPNDHKKKITQEVWNGTEVHILPSSSYSPAKTAVRYLSCRLDAHPLFDTQIEFSEYDIMHVRNDLSMGLLACRLAEEFDLSYVHQISHLKAEAIIEATRQGFATPTGWVKGHLGRQLRRHVANSSDVVLPISDAMKNYLQHNGYTTTMRTLPTGAKVFDRLPNGFDFREKYAINSDFVLLYMGSMSPYRRLEFLFKMLARLKEHLDVELVMAGGRSQRNRERLRNKAEDIGVDESVTFTGWLTDRTEIQQAILSADVGLSPFPTDSILRMNAPIKTLEYMSLGTPVVASDTPDQRQVIEASGGGSVVEYDIESFAQAVQWILGSDEKQDEMSKKGREFIRDSRNFEILADRVEDIYSSLSK